MFAAANALHLIQTSSVQKKASLSIGGVLLAIVAAFFLPTDKDPGSSASGSNAGGGATTTNVVPTSTAPANHASTGNASTGNASTGNASTGNASTGNASTRAAGSSKARKQAKPAALVGGLPASTSRVGFTSSRSLDSHFEKHGREFGSITKAEYLERAKALRDAPLSRTVLELKRSDGVISRFDKSGGGFVAFHKDKTIRTYFRPNDGESYFRRQARR
tara:strand:- start:17 stop:673 length:657 start_codon:yes stop_codon:yes gene_type:complete